MTLLLVMLGAAAGAYARWAVDRFVFGPRDGRFPLGTFSINVAGSLLLGVTLGAASPSEVMALAGTGFCGGFTTFSTFGFESVRLGQEGSGGVAAWYVIASMAAGMAAATLGWYIGSAVA